MAWRRLCATAVQTAYCADRRAMVIIEKRIGRLAAGSLLLIHDSVDRHHRPFNQMRLTGVYALRAPPGGSGVSNDRGVKKGPEARGSSSRSRPSRHGNPGRE